MTLKNDLILPKKHFIKFASILKDTKNQKFKSANSAIEYLESAMIDYFIEQNFLFKSEVFRRFAEED